ncbi:MAG: MFS transporter [Erysipelotrichia bacterium]|nr:MFS transporter [Erysipelotrichia bacterium]
MENLKKYKCFIVCCIMVFIHTGINSVATAVMPQLKIYYGVELSTIISGAAACSIMMFIGGFIGAKFIRKVKPKGAFAVSSLFAALYAFLIFITDKVWGFYVGCAAVGLTAAWGGYATSNIYINKLYEKKAGVLIASLITVGSLGSATFQFISGRLLTVIGLRGVYLCLIFVALFAIVVNYLFLTNIDVDENKGNKTAVENDNAIFKERKFIKMTIVTLFGGTLCGTFGTLCTTFFQSHGIDTAVSATYLSFYTLSCGLLAMIAGAIADKFGYKTYVTYLFVAYLSAISLAIVYDKFEINAILPAMIIAFGLASSFGSIYNMLSKPIFMEKSLVANTKLMSVGSFGSAVLLPTYTKIYEMCGFSTLWILLMIISFICFYLVLSVLKESKL